jgi:hypothetical protein
MARKRDEIQEPKLYVVIEQGKILRSVESWKYYSIVDKLRELKVPRMLAYDTAKWATRAKEGEQKQIGEITIRIERRLF